MNIITKTDIELTPSLASYLEKKFSQLDKFVVAVAKTNPSELKIEIKRTTKHHRKGDVYHVVAAFRAAKVSLRADAEADDVLAAIDAAKDTLRKEIENYKEYEDEKSK